MIREILHTGWEIVTLQMPLYLNIWIGLLFLSYVLKEIFNSLQKKRPLANILLRAIIEGVIINIIAIGMIAFGLQFIDGVLPGHIEPFNRENIILLSVMILTTDLVVSVVMGVIAKNKRPIVVAVVVIIAVAFAFACLYGMMFLFSSAISVSLVVLLIVSVCLSLISMFHYGVGT